MASMNYEEVLQFPDASSREESKEEDVQFPTLDEVLDKVYSDTLPFKLVGENIVYRIIEARNFMTRNGDTMVLTLKDQAGTIVKCYATSLVEREVNRLTWRKNKDVHFLTKLQMKRGKDSGNTYYNFKITTREKKL